MLAACSPSQTAPSTASMQRRASSGRKYVTYALPDGPFLAAAALTGVLRLTDTCAGHSGAGHAVQEGGRWGHDDGCRAGHVPGALSQVLCLAALWF